MTKDQSHIVNIVTGSHCEKIFFLVFFFTEILAQPLTPLSIWAANSHFFKIHSRGGAVQLNHLRRKTYNPVFIYEAKSNTVARKPLFCSYPKLRSSPKLQTFLLLQYNNKSTWRSCCWLRWGRLPRHGGHLMWFQLGLHFHQNVPLKDLILQINDADSSRVHMILCWCLVILIILFLTLRMKFN